MSNHEIIKGHIITNQENFMVGTRSCPSETCQNIKIIYGKVPNYSEGDILRFIPVLMSLMHLSIIRSKVTSQKCLWETINMF